MSFLDKLSEVADKVGDFASDTFDAGKAKAKVLMEKEKIKDGFEALGEYVYTEMKATGQLKQSKLDELLGDIDEHVRTVEAIEAEKNK